MIIGNCIVNNCLTLLVNDMFERTSLSGGMLFLVSTVVPTMVIVLFGEIIPQTLSFK